MATTPASLPKATGGAATPAKTAAGATAPGPLASPPPSGAGATAAAAHAKAAKAAKAASPSSAVTTAGGGSPSKKGHKHTFGVLYTGYLEKINPTRYLDQPKKRFVVLTHMGLHWFKRDEGYDLFGEERGSISVQDITKVDLHVENGAPQPDTFDVTTSQDVFRRIFRAGSPEEAQAWIHAVRAAIKARSLYRRETLQGLNFLPGHAHDEHEHPLVSVVTLKCPAAAGSSSREEFVLAKAPEYHYGMLFDLPYLAPAASSAATAAKPAAPASPGKSPRPPTAATATADEEVVSILLSNGDTAEVPVRSLTDRTVGETVAARVTSLAGHAAHLPLTIEASAEAKAAPEDQGAKKKTGVPATAAVLLDLAVPAGLAALLAQWAHAEARAAGGGGSQLLALLLSLSTDRLALAALVAVALLRALVSAALSARAAAAAAAAASGSGAAGQRRRMVLKVSIDDFVLEPRKAGEAGAAGEDDDGIALPPIPKRFIDGCFGDMVEAERRWRITLAWRTEFGTDGILEREHPYYDIIKDALPHFYCMQGKDGNPVYYERSGQTDLAKARKAGIDWLVWHYIYTTEFLFKELYPSEAAKTITIFDVQGVGMKDLAGEPFEFIRRASALMQDHYPERCKVIIIANTPGWFSFIWKMIRPMVNETTQKKVKIVPAGKETTDAIAEFVDLDKIPVEYGGTLKFSGRADSCRWESPEEVRLREHVYTVNKRFAEERAAQGVATPERMEPTYAN